MANAVDDSTINIVVVIYYYYYYYIIAVLPPLLVIKCNSYVIPIINNVTFPHSLALFCCFILSSKPAFSENLILHLSPFVCRTDLMAVNRFLDLFAHKFLCFCSISLFF